MTGAGSRVETSFQSGELLGKRKKTRFALTSGARVAVYVYKMQTSNSTDKRTNTQHRDEPRIRRRTISHTYWTEQLGAENENSGRRSVAWRGVALSATWTMTPSSTEILNYLCN